MLCMRQPYLFVCFLPKPAKTAPADLLSPVGEKLARRAAEQARCVVLPKDDGVALDKNLHRIAHLQIQRPAQLEEILLEGARKARQVTAPLLDGVQRAVGLGAFAATVSGAGATGAEAAARPPQFKQYREADGRFHFKLVDGQGRVLLQSDGHASPRDAGQVIALLKREGHHALHEMEARAVGLLGEKIGTLGEELVGVDEILEALRLLVGIEA